MSPMPSRQENADITIFARVRARQLRFAERPRTRTEFSGTPGHRSASGSERVNLPQRVEKGVTYRRVRISYRLAAALLYPAPTGPRAAVRDRPGRGG